MAFEQLPLVFAGAAILVALSYAINRKPGADIPSHLPWVGLQHGIFSNLRTRFASLGSSVLGTMESGYREYSKSGLNFVLPVIDGAHILIPGSQVKWIVDQGDHILDAKAMHRIQLQADHTFLDPSLARNPIHENTIRRELTRYLGSLVPQIEDELRASVTECWGCDTENWNEVGVFSTMVKIVARTSNRVFVGLPLCRNEDYLDIAGKYAADIAISSALLRIVPSFLKGLVGLILLLPNRWHMYKGSAHLVPFIQQRLRDLDNAEKTGGSKEEFNDFTTWHIGGMADYPDAAERTPQRIASRLMLVNFAAIHTSTFTATNVLFDIFSSPQADSIVAELREEIEQSLAASDGKWDKNVVARLFKTDSAVRESLRVSTFMSHGMDRLVVDPKGVTLTDGLHLRQGTRIGTSTYSIHHDNDIYPNANTYDAFRFSRAREESLASREEAEMPNDLGEKDFSKVLESKNLSIVTTSETFLPFGHGRHACPGRFFAATEIKLLLAYILMNYDVKPLETRPPNMFMGSSILPPMKATICVKRRKL